MRATQPLKSEGGTQAFLPVRPAELHSAVSGKRVRANYVRQRVYKPAGRTGRRPVFLACAAAKPAQTRRYLAIPELFARLRHCKSLFPRDAETSTRDARATLTESRSGAFENADRYGSDPIPNDVLDR